MSHSHLSHEEFFTRLTSLLDSRQEKGHGSIYLTQKRRKNHQKKPNTTERLTDSVTHDSSTSPPSPTKIADDPLWDTHPPNPLPIIIRATDGNTQSKDRKKNKNKVKLSTVVQPDDLGTFYARYADVCKAGMQALKKRDRSKRKKAKKGKKGEEKK